MKKILFVIGCLSSGGAERQLSGLANMLCDEYDITIATWIDFDDHYKLDSRIKRVRIGVNKSKYVRLLLMMKYILFHNFHCVISYSQEDSVLALTPLIFKFKTKAIASERNYKISKGTILESVLFKILYYRANYIVPNSHAQGEYISRTTHHKNKVRVITNFTDTTIYHPSSYKPNPKTMIGVFARYASQKNYIRFAHAIKQVKDNTSIPFEVHWYGKIYSYGLPNSGYLEFSNLIDELNLKDVIILHDHTTEVQNELMKYDAIALLSETEGFSNVISEAICSGLPVIASDVSDNGIMVKEGINGFLANPLNIQSMANAIEKFLRLPDEKKHMMREQSRLIAEDLFNEESFKSKYIQLIEN